MGFDPESLQKAKHAKRFETREASRWFFDGFRSRTASKNNPEDSKDAKCSKKKSPRNLEVVF
jgi:hypothetical protein